jgi:hypothetical protein
VPSIFSGEPSAATVLLTLALIAYAIYLLLSRRKK